MNRNAHVKSKVNSVNINLAFTRYEKLTCQMGSNICRVPAEMWIPPLPLAGAGTRFSDPGGKHKRGL